MMGLNALKGPAVSHLVFMLLLLISVAGLIVPVHGDSMPDLTLESVWVERVSELGQPAGVIQAGEEINIVATVKNIGGATASGYYVDVYYDGDYGRGGPDNIAPGETQTWYVGPLTAQDGTHTTSWVMDPNNQIQELDETNNAEEYVFTVAASPPSVAVKSKTIFGAELSAVKVKIDKQNYATPFSLSSMRGMHTFTADRRVTISGVRYSFVEWEDETGAVISTVLSFKCDVQPGKTFYAVYKPPQYTITVLLKDANARKVVAGAAVFLDGVLMGSTGSSGRLVIRGIYPGTHQLKISIEGYNSLEQTIELRRSTRFKANLTPIG